MKKLKCKSCSKVWYVEDMEQDSQTSCPFCGESIKKEIQFDNIDSFDKAIYATVKMAGIDILKTPSKLSAYMMDTAPNFKNEIRFILKNISSKYANDIFKAFSDDTQDVNEIFFRIRQRLIDEDFASEKWTDIVCNDFKNASLMMRGINPSAKMSVEVSGISFKSKPTISKSAVKNYSSSDILDSGKCGDNAFWKLLKDGTFIIEGSGDMYDYHWYSDKKCTNSDWYKYNSKIKVVKIESGITSIGEYAFSNCSSLTNITIPNSVTSIGVYAFWHCSNLISITIPDSVTSIGEAAFCSCNSLTNITIPDSVTSIGEAAFLYCSNLTNITIPDSVTSISGYAFASCSNLISITIPNNITSIGEAAFHTCSSLKNITILDSTKEIGIPNSITIDRYAFSACNSLKYITIPNRVTTIGASAFNECRSLTNITIPNSVTTIGEFAFNECRSLTNIIIPDSVASIGYSAFKYCISLKEIRIPAKARKNMDDWDMYWKHGCDAKIIYEV